MRGYLANTDYDWYDFLRQRPGLDEVNFWRPSGKTSRLAPGTPFLFKLKAPHYAVAGFGFFARAARPQPELLGEEGAAARYGAPVLVRPRLGQGTFRLAATDAYGRACAVTTEHSLPVLEAAHIKPYKDGGPHDVRNGLLLRSDLHRLFDKGYVTVTPDLHFEVSRRLKDEFDNGRVYYALHGQKIHAPANEEERPSRELLGWHNERVFRVA